MKNIKCAVYIRTNQETTNTNSQNQISFLKNYISNQDLELYNIYSDISAGSTLERPGIRNLMEDAKEKKFDIILVKDLTRISRNAELTQQFIKSLEATNIKLITLNDVKASSTKGDVEMCKSNVHPTQMRVAVYARVSPGYDSQKISVSAQVQLSKNYVNEKGWELYDIYTDEESGTNSNRAGIQRLIKDAQEKKFDVIVTKELTRISRNSAFLYTFKDAMIANQIHFITLDDTKKH